MDYKNRHIDYKNVPKIEEYLGMSLDEVIDKTIPEDIRIENLESFGEGMGEEEYLDHIKYLMDKNTLKKSFIGQGYYNTIMPNVIKRNILENPSWYTAYTPYQAEISQGRLESLINYQTMITSLTGLEISNASLLDEGTSCAEAMIMLFNSQKKQIKYKCYVGNLFPQTIDVLKSRAEGFNIELEYEYPNDFSNYFAAILPYQSNMGELIDKDIIPECPVIMTTDLLSLTLLEAPSLLSDNIEVVVGSTQRFGLPMGYGGSHSAFFATKEKYKRLIPGRIIGQSIDTHNKKSYRMALQTREQHIRREKATSNICTSQVLLANLSAFYAIYHGKENLVKIATKINKYATDLDKWLKYMNIPQMNDTYFDTLVIKTNNKFMYDDYDKCLFNIRKFDDNLISISFDECTTDDDLEYFKRFLKPLIKGGNRYYEDYRLESIPSELKRCSNFLEDDVFNKYHTEHEILRYMKRLEKKDISLTDSMISLGSCTMKLNATTAMIPLTWESVGSVHPFSPISDTLGYKKLLNLLEEKLCLITGFDKVSYQPNSGSQGEYAGLKVIEAYHKDRNNNRRKVFIPTSAHGTNPASARLVGYDIVNIKCTNNGDIDYDDFTTKLELYKDEISCLMITYPSTHGVFEEMTKQICSDVHREGGLVYMDGANLNAQVGYTNPKFIGADVCHMNLHKTFCIPHGGGGPGMGVIGVTRDLIDYLPQHIYNKSSKGIYAVSSAHYSSASILTISYAYISMMGKYLKDSTSLAILNANYMKAKLENAGYKILYKGKNGMVAHEMIVDFREFKEYGIEVVDVAKRLIDYNYHAPTVSFPVANTLMIEPTESETVEEMDRFCDALINIRSEILENKDILKNAPHTIEDITKWNYDYTIESACFPLDWVKDRKYWSPINRINDTYGDRNLFCTCS